MAVSAEALGALDPSQAGDTTRPEDLTSEAIQPAPPAEKPEAPEKAPVPAEETKGPVPYERFEQVVRARQDLETQLTTMGQMRQLYDLAQTDPTRAAEGFLALARALGATVTTEATPANPALDPALMTDTERALYERVQHLEGAIGQATAGTEAAQDAIAERELGDAMLGLEEWAHEQGYPFDADRVFDAIEELNIEAMIGKGIAVPDIALRAYKAAFFDDLPKVVKTQTYQEQMKKAGATLPGGPSRGGTPRATIGNVRDAVNEAWKKLGLPES